MWVALLMPLLALRAGAETVSGIVRAVQSEHGTVRLTLADPHSPQIVLIRSWFDEIPSDPEAYYGGKSIVVSGGEVDAFRGQREILVRDSRAIVVAGAEGPAATASEVDVLREQIRKLEQRVRELEDQPDE